jgi:hypothetical protein
MAHIYSLKRGPKEFGQEEKYAVQSEFQQHHDMGTYLPVDTSKLTRQQKGEGRHSRH